MALDPMSGWNRRLMRHGGRQAIDAKRIAQTKMLADAMAWPYLADRQRDILKGLLDFLRGNDIRTLDQTTCEWLEGLVGGAVVVSKPSENSP
jgi:hypothetical protein